MVNAHDGFDFLGRHYQKQGSILMGKPSVTAMKQKEQEMGKFIRAYNGSLRNLIKELSAKLRGFGTYHKPEDAYREFRRLDAQSVCQLNLTHFLRLPQVSDSVRKHDHLPLPLYTKGSVEPQSHTLPCILSIAMCLTFHLLLVYFSLDTGNQCAGQHIECKCNLPDCFKVWLLITSLNHGQM